MTSFKQITIQALVVLGLALAWGVATCAQVHAAQGAQVAGLFPFNPSLPVAGGGPIFNFDQGDQAMTNAAAHVGFALAVPLLGEHFWGSKGRVIAGVSWIALTLIHESLFHAPRGPQSAEYPSEVRTDLVTCIVPTLFVLTF